MTFKRTHRHASNSRSFSNLQKLYPHIPPPPSIGGMGRDVFNYFAIILDDRSVIFVVQRKKCCSACSVCCHYIIMYMQI